MTTVTWATTEDWEASMLSVYLKSLRYTFTHIANESGQAWTLNIIKAMKKKKKLGVSRWFPDYCVIAKNWVLVFIELKRQRKVLKDWSLGAAPSKISDEQSFWIEELNKLDNVYAYVAYGYQDALEQLNNVESW